MKHPIKHKLFTIWILTLAIIMTPWLSFWTTPVLANNSQGETVVLCTLQGLQRVTVKTTGIASSDSELYTNSSIIAEPIESNAHCSAIQLQKVFSQALHFPPILSALPHYPLQFEHSGQYTFRPTEPFTAYTGRGPPLS